MKHDIKDAKENRTSKDMMVVINASCIGWLDGGIVSSFPVLVKKVVCKNTVMQKSGAFNHTGGAFCFVCFNPIQNT